MHEGILQFNKLDFSKYELQKSLRQQVIDEVFERINGERVGKYKPLSIRFIATKINTCCKSDTDLDYFIKRCRENGYTKIFFGATKSRQK